MKEARDLKRAVINNCGLVTKTGSHAYYSISFALQNFTFASVEIMLSNLLLISSKSISNLSVIIDQ